MLKLFRRPDYNSEITNFIEEMRHQKPTLEAEQRAGRALLWDKHLDRETQDEFKQARLAQQPYVYQTQPIK